MFDGSLVGLDQLTGLSDAALAQAAAGWASASAAAEARKLAVIAEIERRARAAQQHPNWVVDDLDAAAAGLSCALTISHGRALGQIGLAVTLRDRLPKVGARFLAGQISAAMIATISWRTYLVCDPAALARIDTEIAEHAPAWGPLSQYKLEKAIDFWVERHDPDAVRRVRNGVRGRDFVIGDRDDATGTTSVHGRLTSTDAALLEQRLAAMIATVCDDDPRTLAQRRADALGAIAAHATTLACRCDNPGCAAHTDDGRASNFVVHVFTDTDTLNDTRDRGLDPTLHGPDDPPPTPTPAQSPTPTPAQSPAPKPAEPAASPEPTVAKPATEPKPAGESTPSASGRPARRRRKAALIPGANAAIVPPALLADLIHHGATIRFVTTPDPCGEDRYRPSTALADYIRTRDLTCRFPGCDRPATHADIDHTQPWPTGPTHPTNCKCYCRLHHLIKTFWTGWHDTQHPDGTLTITTPAGLTYTTKPFTALLFPHWNTTTPPPPRPPGPPPPTTPGRHLKMPPRRRARTQTRTARITAERKLNATERALENSSTTPTPPPGHHYPDYQFHPADHTPNYGDDPPPF